MQITLTGTMSVSGIRYNSEASGMQYDSTRYIGYSNAALTKGQNRVFCRGASGDAFNKQFRDSIQNPKVKLKLSLTRDGSQGSGTANALEIRTFSQDYFEGAGSFAGMSYDAQWDYLNYHYDTEKTYSFTSNASDATIEITNQTEIDNIFDKGFALYPAADSSGLRKFYKVESASVEITGETTEAAPEIEIYQNYMGGTFADGTYYHPAGDMDFAVAVIYSQSIGVGLKELQYTVRDAAGAMLGSGASSGTAFVVDKSWWSTLPASGTLEITAVSAHGIPSEVLVLPWVITHYNISVISPVSGSIIKSGNDVVLQWNLILPEGMPSAPMPSRYTIWPAWDEEEEYTVAYGTTSRSYTIPAASLAGHKKLKLLILDEYGSGGSVVRAKGYGKLVMLYLQPTAAVNGLTVGTEHSSGKYTPLLTAQWTASGQTAYRIQADEFDSGPIWGSENQYTIPMIFSDGVHSIRLRIQDGSGNWGEWTEPVYANVENRGNGGTVSLTASVVPEGAKLQMQGSGLTYADVLIYRDGILIAQLPGTATMQYEYTDREAAGIHVYMVRMATDHGFYSQSNPATVDSKPKTDGILTQDGTWIPLRYTETYPRVYTTNTSEETYRKYYAGREYPVLMKSGRKTRTLNMQYIDKTGEICDALEAVCGTVVLYKTTLGQVMRAEINSISSGRGMRRSTVSFRLTECAEPAAVLYRQGVNSVAI